MMPDIDLTFKHGRSQEEARAGLTEAVSQLQSRFGALVQRVEWSTDRDSVHVTGNGFEMRAWVDAQDVRIVGDIPLLGRLLRGPITAGVKQIAERAFHKRLT